MSKEQGKQPVPERWSAKAKIEVILRLFRGGGNFCVEPNPQLTMRKPGRLLHWGKVAFEKWWLTRWF